LGLALANPRQREHGFLTGINIGHLDFNQEVISDERPFATFPITRTFWGGPGEFPPLQE
jgi:hypothetical protein